ncbi:hypothetical protein SAY87_030225 [Trapa incisa]|uniref:Uncharacterized protein n=1 Tax=Trapa incisa TaxID=236973 RepID=A0AAN7KI93_9MYRT|nr:hypothetical protein SAY87_030225 [Trapa incisa]
MGWLLSRFSSRRWWWRNYPSIVRASSGVRIIVFPGEAFPAAQIVSSIRPRLGVEIGRNFGIGYIFLVADRKEGLRLFGLLELQLIPLLHLLEEVSYKGPALMFSCHAHLAAHEVMMLAVRWAW